MAPGTFHAKAEAGRWLASVETDQACGVWVDPVARATSLSEYASTWLRGQVRLSKRTREIYAAQLRLHILPVIDSEVPALGVAALAELTPELIRQWYAALAARRSPTVATKAYTRLRQILTAAVNDDRIARNPCRIARGGVEHHPEQRFVTMTELNRLVNAIPERYRALVIAAGLAGLRQGELFGLRWEDVDLADAAIVVRRKRLRLASGEVIEDGPKSRAGRRKVALPAVLVAELERHRDGSAPTGRPTTTSSPHPRALPSSGATSAVESGFRPRRPLAYQACGFTT